ncbi:unnamed protein product [Owenia fusiformis]|uniref:Uncharacterized protein n=1 Tax=Owenia fusiformis TaxID=6347 RepID=A0A8J1TU27_OWEFU|nr:unnamed protein product [Owenia fusiformis]
MSNLNEKSPHGAKSDVSFVGITGPRSSSSRHSIGSEGSAGKLSNRGGCETANELSSQVEQEHRDELRQRELEEARARAAQMEKTMRWWSDCTANWREKWSKVRNERNKYRDENRLLRAKYEAVMKENTVFKNERKEMKRDVEHLKRQNKLLKNNEKDEASSSSSSSLKSPVVVNSPNESGDADEEKKSQIEKEETDLNEKNPEKLKSKPDASMNKKEQDKMDECKDLPAARRPERDNLDSPEQALALENMAILQLKLNEAQKTLAMEREDKAVFSKSMEKLQFDLTCLKNKYEEQKRSKLEISQQLSKLRQEHKDQVDRMATKLDDESDTRSSMDLRIGQLRRELERLQAENAEEWGMRERLETEKLAQERENKNLRAQIHDLEMELERKNRINSAMIDTDMKTIKSDLEEKMKELVELRHAHSRQCQQLDETLEELDHCRRRAEQYDTEVRKLRGRVDDLKKQLANAEDEADGQSNIVRRLQRTNDEIQQESENLRLQVDHLQSRLRSSNQAVEITRGSSIKSISLAKHPDDSKSTNM